MLPQGYFYSVSSFRIVVKVCASNLFVKYC